MTDKFVVSTNEIGEIIVTDVETDRVYRYDDPSNFFGLIRLLNEQQATIQFLQDEIDELKKDIDIYKYEEKKHSESARKLYEENEQLRQQLKEKEEDEQLYANEILELREANKEFIQFKELGGDY